MRYFPALVVCDGRRALSAASAVVWPVPPFEMGRVVIVGSAPIAAAVSPVICEVEIAIGTLDANVTSPLALTVSRLT